MNIGYIVQALKMNVLVWFLVRNRKSIIKTNICDSLMRYDYNYIRKKKTNSEIPNILTIQLKVQFTSHCSEYIVLFIAAYES